MPSRVLGGRYIVQDKIGTGGMAIVYRGLDKVLGRTVAIKTMLPQYAADPSFAARFKQEAQAAAALQSAYIVSVYDWGKDGDTYYIIMEYLRGTDLKSGIRKHGALDCRKVAQIGSQIALALSAAHRHDIIHRDIKPQNIMVQPDGNIKVMDFGIARAKNSHITTDNSVLGTAHYVSPEQTQGKPLGPTTDLYSLGIVMYEAATGRVPFDGDDAISVALKQVNEQPTPPSQINPNVDAALESIILKCMQKNPNDRFQTADELYHALRDYLAGRLQSVTHVTPISPVATTTIPAKEGVKPVADATSPLARVHSASQTSSQHYRQRATEQDAERKRKRHRSIATFFVVAVVLIGIAIGAYALTHPATQSVPNLIGLTKESALEQIDQSGYFARGTVKEQYDSNVAEGLVIDQDPDAGNEAAEGTQINLVISKGKEPAQDVTVPNLINMTPSEAQAALQKLNLVGAAGDSVYSDTVETGNVAQQSPAAGTTVKAGDTITYQLSKGVESVDVPNVVGSSEKDARAALQNAGFSVSVTSDYSDNYKEGVVSYQSVTGKASKGSEVTITVSLGSSQITIPSVVGLDQTSATTRLQNAGFTVSATKVSSSQTAGTVVWQSSTGTASKGATITIGVSTGSSGTTSGSNTGTDSGNNSTDAGGSTSTQ
ncbi:MAG: Stk1 family PASTA domain-containing Ser/Thr kinase [Atopobiaceae bacterium]|jgi:serine/threonine protein kinase